jgi:hypothetical protein
MNDREIQPVRSVDCLPEDLSSADDKHFVLDQYAIPSGTEDLVRFRERFVDRVHHMGGHRRSIVKQSRNHHVFRFGVGIIEHLSPEDRDVVADEAAIPRRIGGYLPRDATILRQSTPSCAQGNISAPPITILKAMCRDQVARMPPRIQEKAARTTDGHQQEDALSRASRPPLR